MSISTPAGTNAFSMDQLSAIEATLGYPADAAADRDGLPDRTGQISQTARQILARLNADDEIGVGTEAIDVEMEDGSQDEGDITQRMGVAGSVQVFLASCTASLDQDGDLPEFTIDRN